jgi:SWI/SNF-related matrix-associated actin-dependent regulator of chromatin subfamily A member 5
MIETLQTIAFIAHMLHVKKISGPYLIVVPLTVIFNWKAELERFCPSLRIIRVHTSDPVETSRLRNILSAKLEIVLTTYEMLKSQNLGTCLKRITWRAMFLDEGHRIRNEETDVSKACSSVRARFKVVLTGTPLQNNLRETGVILSFLAPNIFKDLSLFENAFDLSAASKVNGSKAPSIDRSLLDKAHYMMRPFVLRRLKSEVEQTLPPKLETLVECPMTELQKEVIQFLLFQQRKVLEALDRRYQTGAKASSKHETRSLMGLMAHLRKAANHPFLFPGVETVSIDGTATAEIITASGKMVVLDKLLVKLISKGHRVVLFSQYTRTLDIICDYLDMKGSRYRRLDGQTNRVMREVNVNLFNKKGSDIDVFCLSTRAGGEGVNLFTADTVILFDSDWNPQVDIQAMARVHRIGQTKTVHVYRLVTKASVDECVVHRAQKKLFLDSMVNRGSTSNAKALDELVSASKPTEVLEEVGNKRARHRDVEDFSDDVETEILEEGEAVLEQSLLFAAIKFGWNSAFSMGDAMKVEHITDDHIEAIIDRTRGIPTPLPPASAGKSTPAAAAAAGGVDEATAQSEASAAAGTVTINLCENQEISIANFNENDPLMSINHIRSNVLQELENQLAPESGQEAIIEELGRAGQRPKRNIIQRTMEVHVEGVGLVQIFKQPETVANKPTGRGQKDVLDGFRKKGASLFVQTEQNPGRQVAGRDYDHQDFCQACWDGGYLILCDNCPCAYHLECLEMTTAPSGHQWSCPHHACYTCKRKASAAGLLFRCEVCECAYCEDCLPAETNIMGECQRFMDLRYRMSGNTCYVRCSQECIEFDEVAHLDASAVREDDDVEELPRQTRAEAAEAPAAAAATSAPASNKTEEHKALSFCLLEDIKHRLGHDEQRVHCRFKKLGEIPNLDVRLQKAHPSVVFALLNIVDFISRRNWFACKARGIAAGDDVGNATIHPADNTAAMEADQMAATVDISTGDGEQSLDAPLVVEDQYEAMELILKFTGVDARLAPEAKTAIFLDAVPLLAALQTHTQQSLLKVLGICQATPIKPKDKEPKFW